MEFCRPYIGAQADNAHVTQVGALLTNTLSRRIWSERRLFPIIPCRNRVEKERGPQYPPVLLS